MTAYIVIAGLLFCIALFLLYLEISDWIGAREETPLTTDEAVEHLAPRGNVDVLEHRNGSG